jgi:hypothetical protein
MKKLLAVVLLLSFLAALPAAGAQAQPAGMPALHPSPFGRPLRPVSKRLGLLH